MDDVRNVGAREPAVCPDDRLYCAILCPGGPEIAIPADCPRPDGAQIVHRRPVMPTVGTGAMP